MKPRIQSTGSVAILSATSVLLCHASAVSIAADLGERK